MTIRPISATKIIATKEQASNPDTQGSVFEDKNFIATVTSTDAYISMSDVKKEKIKTVEALAKTNANKIKSKIRN